MKPLAQNTMIQGRYLIVQLIGKGGMGEVYLAVDQRLGSAVALKRTFFAGDEALGSAFEREARILARMRHPVLPKVSDHFGEGDEQYLVMEHISGDDLSKRLEVAQKPFPMSWVMFWADQLLDALSYLHSHEPPIIHRDIKPQNLKLTDENHIILLDFGLSKSSTGNTQINEATGETSGSSTGSVVGYTPHYAPMEQIRGIGTSPRSDLYSLSATLYQLMTNTVPPDALSRADDLINLTSDPIRPLNEVNNEIPKTVSDVILKGMEVSQEKRYATAREMQKALRKAYATMQEAMTAHTVAFSAVAADTGGEQPIGANLDKTEIMDFGKFGEQAEVDSIPTNVSGGQRSVPDHDATVAFDNNQFDAGPRQADVKTEVFIPGSGGFPAELPQSAPEPDQYTAGNDAWSTPNSGDKDFRTNVGTPQAESENYSPDATMPIVAFDQLRDEEPAEAPAGEFFTTPAAFDPTPMEEGEEHVGTDEEQTVGGDAASSAIAAGVSPKADTSKKKGSVGKIVAIFGGLFLFFVVALAAVGGGWYYYNNYYMTGPLVEPTPSPEPMATPEVTPTPDEPIEQEVGIDTNTNANTSGPDEGNQAESEESALTPLPRPTTTPRVRPTVTPRTTPARTPTPRPTPAATRTRPRILQ